VKKKIVPILVAKIIGSYAFFMFIGATYAYNWNNYKENHTQPIPFSHAIHAGKLQIQCTHCHQHAEHSKHAGSPAVEVCMQCHINVKTESPEVQKIHKAWKEKQPIEWARIHSVRPFIYFPHKRHVQAGINCNECHGPMEHTEVVRQVSSLRMGWCMSCHMEKNAPISCWTCHK
jgi:peptide subunit release factor 1 (eRF1)